MSSSRTTKAVPAVSLQLRQIEYIAHFDPVFGTVYAASTFKCDLDVDSR